MIKIKDYRWTSPKHVTILMLMKTDIDFGQQITSVGNCIGSTEMRLFRLIGIWQNPAKIDCRIKIQSNPGRNFLGHGTDQLPHWLANEPRPRLCPGVGLCLQPTSDGADQCHTAWHQRQHVTSEQGTSVRRRISMVIISYGVRTHAR